ncbi:MAG: glycosyltransferase, partial [Caldilineae bacterium]
NLQVSVLTDTRARQSSPQGCGNLPTYPQIYPQVHHWGWPIMGKIVAFAQAHGVDWIHVQYQTAAYGMHPAINFAPWFWRRRGLRVAWTYHDLLVPYLFPKAGGRLRRWVTERPAFTADRVVVTNEADRLQLAGRIPHLAKIPIGSNIQGVRLTLAERQAHRARWGYDDGCFVLAYFGFLNRSKGGLALVETLHRLVEAGRNAHLLMIGERVGASDPTNFAYLQEVEAAIQARGLSARVRWTGRLPAEEVGAALNAADALVMLYTDGASLRRGTLMAGLANGCAIVTTTPQAPLPELEDGRDVLFVEPDRPEAAAAAVARIADDPLLAERLRVQARARSRLFTWDVVAAHHLALYGSAEAQRPTVNGDVSTQGGAR